MHTATRGLRWGRRAQDTARSLRTVAASRCGPTIRRHEYFAFATSRCACRCGAVLSNDSNLRRRRSRWARWALRPRVTFWARRTSGTLITLWSGLRVAAGSNTERESDYDSQDEWAHLTGSPCWTSTSCCSGFTKIRLLMSSMYNGSNSFNLCRRFNGEPDEGPAARQ